MYKIPDIESSYKENDIGRTLYNFVRGMRPHTVYEFGTLYGYSAVSIGQAIRDNCIGDLTCFDLWEDYPYKHAEYDSTAKTLKSYNIHANLMRCNFEAWIQIVKERKNQSFPDLVHVDISNTGETYKQAYEVCRAIESNGIKSPVFLMEGGTEERDNVEWMVKYDKPPIIGSTRYQVLDERFPGLSIIQ